MVNIRISIKTKLVLPPGHSLYQCGEDRQLTELFGGSFRACSAGGCPGVVPLNDEPDTKFTKEWQLYVYAINFGMSQSAIIALMGDAKAMMNNTGFGDEDNPKANYITGNNLDYSLPRYDKFRTMVRNTHAGYDDGAYLYPLTMNGNLPPLVKDERLRPQSISDMTPEKINNYVYLPKTHLHLFVVQNNVRTKPGNVQSVFPFNNGIRYDWTPDGDIYSFMPFVSNFLPERLRTPLHWWNKVSAIQIPYRRVS